MSKFLKFAILGLFAIVGVSCTQYRYFPIIIPQEQTTPYDVSTPESFTEMLETTGQARLTRSIEVSELPLGASSYSIDLNNQTLTLNAGSIDDRLVLDEGVNLSMSNGTFAVSIDGGDPSISCIKLTAGSSLTLTNAMIRAGQTGILADEDSASIVLNNSTIIADGGYAIGTNAKDGDRDIVIRVINGSRLIANNGTGILFNIEGELYVENSYVEGGTQAIILRGGEGHITNSQLVSNGNAYDSSFESYLNQTWGTGNAVPFAALVVGNRSTSYNYTTTCTVDEQTTITMNHAESPRVYVSSANGKDVKLTIREDYAKEIVDGKYYWGKNTFVNDMQTALTVDDSGNPTA